MSKPITNLSLLPLQEDRDWHVLTISAKSLQNLLEVIEKYMNYLLTHPEINFADFCYNSNLLQNHYSYRLAICAQTGTECGELLKKHVQKQNLKSFPQLKKIAFLYTGAGSQYTGMTKQLYLSNSIFRHTIDQCHEILEELFNISLIDILYLKNGESINEILHTQVSIFSIEVALSRLWESWGIIPDAVMGHSLGEYAAAYKAKMINLKDSLKLVGERGGLMQKLPENVAMVAALTNITTIKKVLKNLLDHVAIAAENSPYNTTLSGRKIFIEVAKKRLVEEGIEVQMLNITRAGHSAEMAPILPDFRRSLNTVAFSLPEIKIVSNLTGNFISPEIPIQNEYWCRQLCETVKFSKGLETLQENNIDAFVEIGSKPLLITLGKQSLSETQLTWLSSLHMGQPDWKSLGNALCELYIKGITIDWKKFDSGYKRLKSNLPNFINNSEANHE
ncbi:MAG TPA: acyltransferase domain-containing protein [Patescibacteria group bacterium]|nr:acyltransferase domain-containing protein [Gammaproteobacteria bacterium]HWA51503.1 acyltransferase domain-containing protein [Patescibacteria group bacterium]